MKQLLLDRALGVGERDSLTGRTHHYLAHVRRVRVGSELTALDGRGERYRLRVVAVRPDETEIERLPGADDARAEASNVIVCPALLKGRALDTVIRQLTELGVDRIVPIITARCVPDRTGDSRQQRWATIATAAVQQSGRRTVVRIDPPTPLAALGPLLHRAIVFHETGRQLPAGEAAPWSDRAAEEPVVLLLGPEGGFDVNEIAHCIAAGATVVGAPFPVLRAETAAVALSAIVLFARAHYTAATDHER